MFFSLYWQYLALAFCAYISFRLYRGHVWRESASKRSRKRKINENVDEQRIEQVMDNQPSSEEDEDEWIASLENVKHVPLVFNEIPPQESIQRAEKFYQFMNKRRTIRHFSNRPVPIEVVRNCIRTAGTSPSGAHTEPWTFVLVGSSEIKGQIRLIIEEEEEINYKKRMGKVWTGDLKPFKTNWVKEYLTEAPYLILVFKQTYSYRQSDGKKKMHYYNEQSICIAAGFLLAAIHNAGLCSLTSTPLNCGPALRALLERPSNEKLVLLLPVGYPAKGCQVPGIQRKQLNNILVET